MRELLLRLHEQIELSGMQAAAEEAFRMRVRDLPPPPRVLFVGHSSAPLHAAVESFLDHERFRREMPLLIADRVTRDAIAEPDPVPFIKPLEIEALIKRLPAGPRNRQERRAQRKHQGRKRLEVSR